MFSTVYGFVGLAHWLLWFRIHHTIHRVRSGGRDPEGFAGYHDTHWLQCVSEQRQMSRGYSNLEYTVSLVGE